MGLRGCGDAAELSLSEHSMCGVIGIIENMLKRSCVGLGQAVDESDEEEQPAGATSCA